MPRKSLSMRRIRGLARLSFGLGRSHREIAASLGVAAGTVNKYVRRAKRAGLSWPLPEGMDDAALTAALRSASSEALERKPEPDWEERTGSCGGARA